MLKEIIQAVRKVTKDNPGFIMVAVVGALFSVWHTMEEWRTCRLGVFVGEAYESMERGSTLDDAARPKLDSEIEWVLGEQASLDEQAANIAALHPEKFR
jgi:hypothetical protein